ncbi:hypothetical protein OGAPHI_002561 [Ogataea philodendri]|uniref:GAF domain-containing protein n=1 Tax=Ogataea philodendri TaxID=1378263 RepID=A0A9P8T7H0_9ASCO|nr:uncharacterized protein OGAPHI_002561 [Ogataea philodendri]KAH3668806.1 hypothetical protein OGAPHI_002561 [Ogataea philodendri]
MAHHADYSDFSANTTKQELLQQVIDSYQALSEGQTNWVCNLANCSSLVWHCYNEGLAKKVNWAGFYVVDPADNKQLILGPFMGKVACQTIKIGQGVCGAAAASKQTQLVPDVEKFPGHIACDGETKSEIVVPIVHDDKLVGVLDIDCLELNGFDTADQQNLEALCKLISESSKW